MRFSAPPRDRVWDVVVVGAGLGGLSAAAYLARQGRRVLVLEQHDVVGGYAHRFLRKARSGHVYAFDVALHQMGSLAPGRLMRRAWEALGVLPRLELRRFDVLYRTVGPAHDLRVPADAESYRAALTPLFPEHARGIRDLFAALRAVDLGCDASPMNSAEPRAFAPPAFAPQAFAPQAWDALPTSTYAWLGRSLAEVIEAHVPDARFAAIFSTLWAYFGVPPSELCAFTFAQMWSGFHHGGAFYVKGGGQALSEAWAEVIEEAGGQVVVRSPVQAILTRAGRVAGVATSRFGELEAAVVVSNASPQATFERLVTEPALVAADRRRLRATSSPSIVEAYVGVKGRACSLDDRLLFETATYDCDEQAAALRAGDLARTPTVLANHALADPSCAPAGCAVLNVACLTEGASWQTGDDESYRVRKEAAELLLLDRLRARVPELDDILEISEVGTPRTMARYSWNPEGAIYGAASSTAQHPLRRPTPRCSLAGLYLAGAWTFPGGGFQGAMTSGLNTGFLVCQDLAAQGSPLVAEPAVIAGEERA